MKVQFCVDRECGPRQLRPPVLRVDRDYRLRGSREGRHAVRCAPRVAPLGDGMVVLERPAPRRQQRRCRNRRQGGPVRKAIERFNHRPDDGGS